jgi:hypothetical protein
MGRFSARNVPEQDPIRLEPGGKLEGRWFFGPIVPSTYVVRLGVNMERGIGIKVPGEHEPVFWTKAFPIPGRSQPGRGGSIETEAEGEYEDEYRILRVRVERVSVDEIGITLWLFAQVEGDGLSLFSDHPRLFDDAGTQNTSLICSSPKVNSAGGDWVEEGEPLKGPLRFYPTPPSGAHLKLTLYRWGCSLK